MQKIMQIQAKSFWLPGKDVISVTLTMVMVARLACLNILGSAIESNSF